MKERMDELKKSYHSLDEVGKKALRGLEKYVEKNAMEPEEVAALIDNRMEGDTEHPEIASFEKMTSGEFAEFYKKMADDVKSNPEKYEEHTKVTGMTQDEMALLFTAINGVVEDHPEVWEAQEAAQLLSPKNLLVLLHLFKKEK